MYHVNDIEPAMLESIKKNSKSLHNKAMISRSLKYEGVLNLPLSRIAEVTPVTSDFELANPIEIAIVGCGGTGGYLVRDLSRFLYSIDRRLPGASDITVTLYDGDLVEEKNILRQNFLPQDIGQNKAEVLCSRHVRAFGVNLEYVPAMFDRNSLDLHSNTQKIIIGCVDNNAARREIAESVEMVNSQRAYSSNSSIKKICWIDSGNERKSGQVILGNKLMPDVTDIYPEILDPSSDSKEVISCAERLLEDEQNMFVNLTASNLILNFVRKVVLNEPIIFNGSVFNIDNQVSNYYLIGNK